MAVSNVAYDTVLINEEIIKSSIHTPPKGWGVRHLQTLLLFACLVMGFSMRSQLSVLMVAMIDSNNHENCNVSSNVLNESINFVNEKCKASQNVSNWSIYRTYGWDKSTQEMITFAFFVGYTGMQLPMGWLAQKVGGKIPIMVALAVNGILSICMPWIALIGGWMAVYAGRLIQGMTQAAFYPSMHTMLARWTPLRERGRLTTYAYSGSQIGTIVAFQISGLFAGSPLIGWPASFWLFGVLSLIVCGLFGWLGAASPHEHPRLTTDEFVYILEDCNADAVPKNLVEDDNPITNPFYYGQDRECWYAEVAANACEESRQNKQKEQTLKKKNKSKSMEKASYIIKRDTGRVRHIVIIIIHDLDANDAGEINYSDANSASVNVQYLVRSDYDDIMQETEYLVGKIVKN